MDDKKKKLTAGAIAAGIGTYALARRPSTSSAIYKLYGKHLEPIVARAPWGKVKDYEKESLVDKITWHPWKKVDIDYSGINKLRKEPQRDAAMIKRMIAGVKKIPKDKYHLIGMETLDPSTKVPMAIKRLNRSVSVDEPVAKRILDKPTHQRMLSKTPYGIKTHNINRSDVQAIKHKNPKELKEYFDKRYGRDKWIMKPRSDELHDLGTSGEIKPGHSRTSTRGKFFKVLKKAPTQHIRQVKEPIEEEFRVSVVDNKPIAIVPRYDYGPLGWGLPKSRMLNRKLYGDIEKVVRSHNKAVGMPKNRIHHGGYDIAMVKKPNGKMGYKVIEANVGASGGELDSPLINWRLYKHLTGRDPHAVAAAKGVGVAGAGTAASNIFVGNDK